MKFPLRSLFLGIALAWPLLLASLAPAQDAPAPNAAEKAAPPAQPAAGATPAAPDAATPPVEAATPAPAPAAAPPLRRLDQPAGEVSVNVRYRRGNEFPLGDHTIPRDVRVSEAVSVLGSTTVLGEAGSDAVSILGNTTIGRGAKIGGAAIAILGRLRAEGDIGDEAVSVLGGVYLDAHVRGEVVSILGDVELGPNAIVDGDLVLVGGRLTKHANAIIHGNEINVPNLGHLGNLDWLVVWVKDCLIFGRLLGFDDRLGWAWGVALLFLALYVVLALLFRRSVDRCVETLVTRPGRSILASIYVVILTPIAITLLAVTVIGIPVIPFLAVGLLCASLFGKAVMLATIGRPFTRVFGNGPLGHAAVSVLIGGVIVLLLYTVPVIGILTFKLLGWLGFGVVMYTLMLNSKREKPAAANGAPVPPPPPAPPSSGPAPATPPFVPVEPVASVPLHAVPVEVVSDASSSAAASSPLPPIPPVPPLDPAAAATPPPSAASIPAYTPPPPRAATTWPRATDAAVLPRVGFWPRLGVMLLDIGLIGAVVIAMNSTLPYILRVHNPPGFLTWVAAYATLMWKLKGTTIAGAIFGHRVVRLDGRPVDWPTALVRALGCFLSTAAGGFGFIWVALDDEKQSWHDKLAGTTIVRLPKAQSLI